MKLIGAIFVSLSLVSGQRDVTRIIGGRDAQQGAYPFVGLLINFKSSSFCGSSLISDRWLVTAAHCVYGSQASDIQITLGTNDFDIGSARPIDTITIHSQYNPTNQANDIAVIRLSNRVSFSAIKIPRSPPVSDGETLRAIGWGLQQHNATSPASKLQEVDLQTISRDACRTRFASFQGNGSGTQICTGDRPGKDTCSGDSGGPLMRRTGNNWKLVGLTSFGAWDNRVQLEATCGVKEVVGIYTNLMMYLNFISTATGLNQNQFT